jgi:hypothetical protein
VVTREQIDTAIEQLRDVLGAGTPTCEEKN